jgi:hypothetical protein
MQAQELYAESGSTAIHVYERPRVYNTHNMCTQKRNSRIYVCITLSVIFMASIAGVIGYLAWQLTSWREEASNLPTLPPQIVAEAQSQGKSIAS